MALSRRRWRTRSSSSTRPVLCDRSLQGHRCDGDFRAEPGRARRPLRVSPQALNTAGTSGQFRTPRHIIRMMVKMQEPRPGERICDPALSGTCGFLVNAWQHVLETHTDPRYQSSSRRVTPMA
ncbi:MAG: N-6 DNA methylase [Propionivibrio sp.]|nr:N-6 DNA methylase [Propionivibrio sp.]